MRAFFSGPLRSGGRSRSLAPTQIRLALVATLFVGWAAILVWRLSVVQIRDTGEYQTLADQERRAEIPIPARRGSLLDTQGEPLAESVLYDSVSVLGPLVGDPDKTAQTLAPILDEPVDQIRQKIDKSNQQVVVLKSAVPSAVSQQIQQLNLSGVYLEQEPIRQYPEGSIASQILGFVGEDGSGLGGLELSWDKELAGQPGVIDTEKDTTGAEITLGRRLLTPPTDGSDLELTIDRHVQEDAESLLNQAVVTTKSHGGLIIVMEPSTGDILAAASNPTYSLTDTPIYDPDKAALYKTTIVTNQFEPGSTMKTVTMASALQEGAVTPNTTMVDTGVANIDGTLIHNWNDVGNGTITMTQLLILSDNVGATWVSGKLGPDLFYQHVHDFGFGTVTGIRLPGEVPGTVRDNTTPGWSPVDLATNAFGQGIAVTPLQLMDAVASFGNGGLMMQPRIVREVHGPNGTQEVPPQPVRQVISPTTARTLLDMLEQVAPADGLGVDDMGGYRIALKTGTADTPTDAGYNTAVTVASVVGLFPAAQPRFAVLVRLDGPVALYGGPTAAPVLKSLAQDMLAYYRIPPSEPVKPQPTGH